MILHDPKNPESAKYASCLARAQDAIRSANEDTIKLSQRFGRMMPKLQRLDSPAILSWFNLYNKVKDAGSKADEEIAPLLGSEQSGLLIPFCNRRSAPIAPRGSGYSPR